MVRFRVGDLVIPFVSIKGVIQEYPVGKLIKIENGGVFHVDLCYNLETPKVIRCCLVKKV